MKPILYATMILASAFIAGCATANAGEADQAANTNNDLSYRPGSRIPVRNAPPLTQEEKDKQAEDARNALSNSPRPAVIH